MQLFDGGPTTDPEPEATATVVGQVVATVGGVAVPRTAPLSGIMGPSGSSPPIQDPPRNTRNPVPLVFPSRTVARGLIVAAVPSIL